jgi:hypothetical protein
MHSPTAGNHPLGRLPEYPWLRRLRPTSATAVATPTGTCGRHTALHTASYRGHAGVIAALLLAGANEHLTTNSGCAPAALADRCSLIGSSGLVGQADAAAGGSPAAVGPRQALQGHGIRGRRRQGAPRTPIRVLRIAHHSRVSLS